MMSPATETTTQTTFDPRRRNLISVSNEHVIATLICLTCMKILLIPSYRSTDFDVHRNWLAITKHLPLSEWYFDNINGTTVHTLDYPPTFAYFEYFWSHILQVISIANVDDRCFELLPDAHNDPSVPCVIYHRLTVILSDTIFWMGAYLASSAICCGGARNTGAGSHTTSPPTASRTLSEQPPHANLIFLLIVTNPGLLYLDHVHFQYNGMLLGILLLSIGCLLGGFQKQQQQQQQPHLWIMGSAILYALLVTMKHLYMVLAPLYFIVILKHYCYYSIIPPPPPHTSTTRTTVKTFSLPRFLAVALVTGSTLIGPFIPFLRMGNGQLPQILSRLFPFGRGLVHDYWAGNVWALYVFADKCIAFTGRKLLPSISMLSQGLPDVPPSLAALSLLCGIMPAMLCAAKYKYNHNVVTDDTTTKFPLSSSSSSSSSLSSTTGVGIMFLHGIVFCSLSSFMLAYHVHEKAIMTAIIPMTLLVTSSPTHATLFWRLCTLGHFGLLPLLFRPVELLFKIVAYMLYMAFSTYALDISLTRVDKCGIGILAGVSFFSEVLHPLLFQPRGLLEFLPLMMTSLVCAIGLIGCWIHEGLLMLQQLQL